MERTIHMCIDIRGALNLIRKKKDSTKSFANHDDGRVMTNGELRTFLYDALADGKEVLPMTQCDNFDYKKGCRGHYTCITKDIDFETGNG